MVDNETLWANETEILFLGYMIKSLRLGGRCGVVVPEGLLVGTTTAHKAIRRILFEKCKLAAVVSVPAGCFKPYSGVKTSILIVKKGEPTKEVWFYEVQNDGYSLDDKRRPTPDKNNIPDLLENWTKDQNGTWEPTDKSWKATIDEIKENDFNLSASRYKPLKIEEVEYEDLTKLIKEVLELEEEISKNLKELERMI